MVGIIEVTGRDGCVSYHIGTYVLWTLIVRSQLGLTEAKITSSSSNSNNVRLICNKWDDPQEILIQQIRDLQAVLQVYSTINT